MTRTPELAIVCYSGGEASARVAVEAVKRFGKNNVILLNHDISSKVEHQDIKRFKQEVADYLDVPITYANAPDFEEMTPLAVSRKCGTFGIDPRSTFCTSYLKTQPFYKWLDNNYPSSFECPNKSVCIMYGFDAGETVRIQRRSSILGAKGYFTDYPLAFWPEPLPRIEDIGIHRPSTYRIYKHANCIGCLKARKQHWYCVYCLHPDLWEEAKQTERELGRSIMNGSYLEEVEPQFREMREDKGICPTQQIKPQTFWAEVERRMPGETGILPCDCAV